MLEKEQLMNTPSLSEEYHFNEANASIADRFWEVKENEFILESFRPEPVIEQKRQTTSSLDSS